MNPAVVEAAKRSGGYLVNADFFRRDGLRDPALTWWIPLHGSRFADSGIPRWRERVLNEVATEQAADFVGWARWPKDGNEGRPVLFRLRDPDETPGRLFRFSIQNYGTTLPNVVKMVLAPTPRLALEIAGFLCNAGARIHVEQIEPGEPLDGDPHGMGNRA